MSNPTLRFKSANGLNFPDTVSCTLSDISKYSKGTIERKNCLFIGNEQLVSNFGGATLEFRTEAKGTEFNNGDILFGNIRPYLKKVWLSDQSGIASPDVLIFKVTDSIPGYLKCILSSERFFNHVAQGYKGSKMPRGDKHQIMDFRIQCPCLEEQQKIASFFSTLDQKIEINERKLEALEKLKKGLMQKIFNQEIRFKSKSGKNFPNWIKKPLDSVIASSGGHTPNMKNKALWEPGEYFWVTPKDMKSEYVFSSEMKISELGLKELKLHEPGTILLVARSGVLKHTLPLAFLRIQATINQDLKAISVTDEIISGYLFFFLQSKSNLILNNYVKTGTTVQSIMMNDFYAMMVDIPCLEEQRQIAATLFIFNEKIGIMTQKIALLKQLKQGFMQQMFV